MNPVNNLHTKVKYSLNSMAPTSLGTRKFVLDMGSSSHWGLIIVPGQVANVDNSGVSFQSPTKYT